MDNDQAVETQKQDTLPEWARKQISEANAEAAKYRTEKKDAVEAAKAEVAQGFQSKIQELEASIQAAESEKVEARREVDKLKAALGAGIESEKVVQFAGLLQGDTVDALRSNAEELKKLFGAGSTGPQRAVDASQGNVPSTPLNGDPLLESLKRKLNIS